MKVYMVLFDWSTEDDEAVEVQLFDTYDKAYKRYREIIEQEMNPDLSWVGEDAFDDYGNIEIGFSFDEHDWGAPYDCWWNVTDKNDWNRHDFLDLREMEVM